MTALTSSELNDRIDQLRTEQRALSAELRKAPATQRQAEIDARLDTLNTEVQDAVAHLWQVVTDEAFGDDI